MNKEEREIFMQTATEVDEVHSHMRKGIAQNYYVAEIEEDVKFWDIATDKFTLIPKHMTGLWRMRFPSNLQYVSFSEARDNEDWCKCLRKEVVSYEYEVLE